MGEKKSKKIYVCMELIKEFEMFIPQKIKAKASDMAEGCIGVLVAFDSQESAFLFSGSKCQVMNIVEDEE